jgi:hypothetical protein
MAARAAENALSLLQRLMPAPGGEADLDRGVMMRVIPPHQSAGLRWSAT